MYLTTGQVISYGSFMVDANVVFGKVWFDDTTLYERYSFQG
jgi:hypothetical protein